MITGRNIERFTEDLGSDDGTGDGILLWHRLLKKELQGFPGVATQIGRKIPVIATAVLDRISTIPPRSTLKAIPIELKEKVKAGLIREQR